VWKRLAILTCALLACDDAGGVPIDASGDDAANPFGGPCVDALAPATFAKLATCAPCPPTLPDAGEACDGDVLECEYGSDPRVQCNWTAACLSSLPDAGPHWTTEAPSTLCGAIAAQCNVACLDASTACVKSDQICIGDSCNPIRGAALGCPCDGGVDWSVEGMACSGGQLQIAPPSKH
jgi:hypothetical protein